MDTEPIAVALKFGFLAVLYLFLLWVARSAYRELRRTSGAGARGDGDPPTIGPGGAPPPPTPGSSPRRGAASTRGSASTSSAGISIGRSSDADVRIEDRFASGVHARVYSRGANYYVEDMNSTNGTFLNGGRLNGEAQLNDLDEVRIGNTEFRFELDVPGGDRERHRC